MAHNEGLVVFWFNVGERGLCCLFEGKDCLNDAKVFAETLGIESATLYDYRSTDRWYWFAVPRR